MSTESFDDSMGCQVIVVLLAIGLIGIGNLGHQLTAIEQRLDAIAPVSSGD